jgi:hypothetical protein
VASSSRSLLKTLVVAVSLAALAACNRGPLQLETIQLGRSLNPDNTVAGHTSTFARNDTIYVSVLTTDAGSGTIGVKWMYEGSVIGEPSKQVSFNGPGATSFQLVNAGGFPPGDYSVEVFIDGRLVGTRRFHVQ